VISLQEILFNRLGKFLKHESIDEVSALLLLVWVFLSNSDANIQQNIFENNISCQPISDLE